MQGQETFGARSAVRVLLALLISGSTALVADAGTPKSSRDNASGTSAETARVTRLIFQDHEAAVLKWTDVHVNEQNQLSLATVGEVAGFPKVDAKEQKLVQMAECLGIVLVGIRDEENGQHESGWVVAHTGVGYADHGDHGHWHYKKSPEVWDHCLDKQQGNPAHVYLYDECFYVANDARNGYTRIDPAKYASNDGRKLGKDKPRFLVGGGNHITLAVVENQVGYSCWIDGGGPRKGQVDVTRLHNNPKGEPAYSFHLPTGVIHGATANSGKVFFAPADGICWVQADLKAKLQPADVKVYTISLGKDGDKPCRTGAFADLGHYVLCVTGRGASSALVLLDANVDEPKPVRIPLDVQPGTRALTPIPFTTAGDLAYAMIFHDREKAADTKTDNPLHDKLQIVALDPNKDGDYRDAKVIKTLDVGASAVQGHFGHHDLAFDADKNFAFFTNPGDGTISALSIKSWEIVGTFQVGGKPTALIARGGQEVHD